MAAETQGPEREGKTPAASPAVAVGPAEPRAFSNEPVAPGALPDYSATPLEPVAPGFPLYATLSSGVFWLLLAGAALVARVVPALPVRPTAWVPATLLLIGAWSVALAWLDARRRGWALREHDLVYRSGVLWTRTVVLPFARIQHVETASGPLERVFGLTRLKCYTAGGLASDLTVLGLATREALRVREYLLEQIRDDEPAPGG